MKIIVRGTPPSEVIWDGRCPECGTLAEATGGELADVGIAASSGPNPLCYFMTCPVCSSDAMEFKRKSTSPTYERD